MPRRVLIDLFPSIVECRMRFHRLMAKRFARKRAWRGNPLPMVSFTFDDFPRSALTMGGKMLIDYGCRGTYYGALGMMGRTTYAGPIFTRPDLDALLAGGHELGCHTFEHTSCFSVTTAKFADGCTQNRQQAAAMLERYQLRSLSFPHGHITLGAKRVLRSFYDTCRSIEWGTNSDPVDLGFLRANPIYSRLPIEGLKQLIDYNRQAKGWLILYTHDLSANPSPYGCTPEYFEAVLRCVAESGAEVMTIREATSRYTLCSSNRSATADRCLDGIAPELAQTQ